MTDKTIDSTRRKFIKATVAGSGAIALTPLASVAHDEKAIEFDERYDVVVVGSGFGGLTAALQARELGLSVLLIEKMPTFGGSSCLNGSGFAVPGTKEQQQLGIEDNADIFEQDILRSGRFLNSPDLAHILAHGAKDAFEWVQSHGVKFADGVYLYGGHSVSRIKIGTHSIGGDITVPLRKQGEALGAEYRTRCSLEEILMDDKVAIGVKVKDHCDWQKPGSGVTRFIAANKGVVMATGGYARDVQFRMLQDPRLDASIPNTNQPGASAQGLKAILKVGGAPRLLSYIQIGPWGSPDEHGYGDSPDYSPFAGYTHGIAVDVVSGKRFLNETGDRTVRANLIMDILKHHPGAYPVLICDSIGHNDKGIPETRRKRIVESGVVKAFDTLEALANFYDIPVEPFLAQVKEYNRAVEAGEDIAFGKVLARLKPIEEAPFYAQRISNMIHYTEGGVAIDKNASVISLDGEPIERLYAVGEVASGAHGASRLGGCGTADPIVMGRIAAKHIANQTKEGAQNA